MVINLAILFLDSVVVVIVVVVVVIVVVVVVVVAVVVDKLRSFWQFYILSSDRKTDSRSNRVNFVTIVTSSSIPLFVGHCLTDRAHLQVDICICPSHHSVIGRYHRYLLLIGGL